jgi:Flp pilus assembly protein TadB
MNIKLIAELAGVLIAAGVVLGIVAVTGTTRPPRPQAPSQQWLARLWRGEGLGARDRRSRQMLLVLGAIGGAVAWLATGMPVVGLIVLVTVPGAPWLFTVGGGEKRAIARIEAVGEWTRRLKDISTTGVGLQQAIVASTATTPAEIGDEVRNLAARLQAGWDARIALLMFADDIADPVCDQVVAALILNLTDRGEHLGDVLGSIASAAAAEVATRREVEAKRTQPRFAVKFLTGMTLLTLGYGATRAEYMRPYASPTGQLVMAGLTAVFVALLLWVRSMSLPPRVPRFLATPRTEEVAL